MIYTADNNRYLTTLLDKYIQYIIQRKMACKNFYFFLNDIEFFWIKLFVSFNESENKTTKCIAVI